MRHREPEPLSLVRLARPTLIGNYPPRIQQYGYLTGRQRDNPGTGMARTGSPITAAALSVRDAL